MISEKISEVKKREIKKLVDEFLLKLIRAIESKTVSNSDKILYAQKLSKSLIDEINKKIDDIVIKQKVIVQNNSDGAVRANKCETCVKQATIRGDRVRACPFGLPVPDACLNAGESIYRMASSEDEDILKTNLLIYAYHKDGNECPYADKVIEEKGKVDCDFGDTAQGMKSTSFRGSPLFPSIFTGFNMNGIQGYPLGWYSDYDQMRNMFFGLYSIIGNDNSSEIIKKS